VCCNALQCVARLLFGLGWRSRCVVLQWVAVGCSMLQCVVTRCSVLRACFFVWAGGQGVLCYSGLQWAVVRCRVLERIAVCCALAFWFGLAVKVCCAAVGCDLL